MLWDEWTQTATKWGGCADNADGLGRSGRDDGRRWGEGSTW